MLDSIKGNSTRVFDKLHVYKDGTQNFISCNSDITHNPQYTWAGYVTNNDYYCDLYYHNKINCSQMYNKAITDFFKLIEDDIN